MISRSSARNAPRPRISPRDLKKSWTPTTSPDLSVFLSFHILCSSVNRHFRAPISTSPYSIMGSTSQFPRIKEIRTFVIDGVGSGGDYHNV